MVEITFIGTGSGKASLKRYYTSTIFSANNHNLLLDAGDGISRALLGAKVDFNSVNSILFSHFHPDHLNGISSLLIQMKMAKRTEELKLLVHHNLYSNFIRFLESGYIFKERMGFEVRIQTYGSDSFFRVSDNIAFISRENSHLSKYTANTKDESTLVSSSFLIYAGDRRIYYSGDLGGNEDFSLFDNEKPFDAFISEVTHIELSELENAIMKTKPEKIYLNHISDGTEKDLEKWINSLDMDLKKRIRLTFDGFRVKI